MELLRIIAMLFILMLHVNFMSLGTPNSVDFNINPLTSFLRLEFEALAIVGVNVFVLISGWFGIRLRAKSVCKFVFQVLFWGVLVYAIAVLSGLNIHNSQTALKILSMQSHWFVLQYLFLMLLSPILNAYIEKSGRQQLRKFLIYFFLLQTIFDWAHPFWEIYKSGYSVVSFIGLYLLGRYLNTYKPSVTSWKFSRLTLMYLAMSTIPALLVGLIIWQNPTESLTARACPWLMSYCSPFVIMASVCLVLAFSKIKLQKRWINWVAASAFSVYLIHMHPSIFIYYKNFSRFIYEQYSVIGYLSIIALFMISVFIACILLDQLRLTAWILLSKLYSANNTRERQSSIKS